MLAIPYEHDTKAEKLGPTNPVRYIRYLVVAIGAIAVSRVKQRTSTIIVPACVLTRYRRVFLASSAIYTVRNSSGLYEIDVTKC